MLRGLFFFCFFLKRIAFLGSLACFRCGRWSEVKLWPPIRMRRCKGRVRRRTPTITNPFIHTWCGTSSLGRLKAYILWWSALRKDGPPLIPPRSSPARLRKRRDHCLLPRLRSHRRRQNTYQSGPTGIELTVPKLRAQQKIIDVCLSSVIGFRNALSFDIFYMTCRLIYTANVQSMQALESPKSQSFTFVNALCY